MLGAIPDLAGLQLVRIGHSPQRAARGLSGARLEGIETSLTARLAAGTSYAMQSFRKPVTLDPKRRNASPSTQAALLALADARARTEARRWPSAFLPALRDPNLIRPA